MGAPQGALKCRPPGYEAERSEKHMYKIIGRYKIMGGGAIITESVKIDSFDENGVSIRRFTATIRGWRNFRIYEGSAPGDKYEELVLKPVESLRERIDIGDETVFTSPLSSILEEISLK
jgi:hypothetical protein